MSCLRRVPADEKDIDRELKRACEDLISLCAEAATRPLRTFLDQCTAYLSKTASSGQTSDLPAQAFASAEQIKEAHDTFKAHARGELDRWTADLMRYLQDGETVWVLVPPAHVSLFVRYVCSERG